MKYITLFILVLATNVHAESCSGFSGKGTLLHFECSFSATSKKYALISLNKKVRVHQADEPSSDDVFSDASWGLPGSLIESENSHFEDVTAVDAYIYTQITLAVLKNRFGRNGFDNKDSAVIPVVHFAKSGPAATNARWWSRTNNLMVFGDGNKTTKHMSASLEVLAHELGHGIISTTSQLGNSAEASALNEAFGDIFGIYVDYVADPKNFNFEFGEELFLNGGNLRNIANPKISHYSKFSRGTDSAHENSGIISYSFYLLTKRIGMDRAAQIYFKAITQFMNTDSQFKDLRSALMKAARDLSESEDTFNFVDESLTELGL